MMGNKYPPWYIDDKLSFICKFKGPRTLSTKTWPDPDNCYMQLQIPPEGIEIGLLCGEWVVSFLRDLDKKMGWY